MGKAEQFKFERRMMEAQKQAAELQKTDRNKLFGMGFISGVIATALLGSIFMSTRQTQQAATNASQLIGTSASGAPSQINVPQDIKLNTNTADPLQLGQ